MSHLKRKKLTLSAFRSPETGIIECEIRLPCNPKHTLGSACIAKWLKSHNSCPICRHEFFPQTGDDSDDEDDIDEGNRNRPTREARTARSDEAFDNYLRAQAARTARISGLVLSYCTAFQLNASVTQCSQTIRETAEVLGSLEGRSDTSIAAACVYMASHLRRQPKTLREISQLADTTDRTIQTVYRHIYAYHHSMPDMWRSTLGTPSDLATSEALGSASVSINSTLLLHLPNRNLESQGFLMETIKLGTFREHPIPKTLVQEKRC